LAAFFLVAMKCLLRLNELFSQGSRQGTLMPGATQ